MVVQHGQTAGAVTGGAVDLTPAAEADVAGGVGHLPAVDEQCRVLSLAQSTAVGQGQVIGRVPITATWRDVFARLLHDLEPRNGSI